jgi:DNA-binding transcriptional LysR family regulator
MVVQARRPAADFSYLPELDAEDNHLHAALLGRARAVCQQARETVAHSKKLAWLLGQWREQPLVSRCAWCRRYQVADGWFEARWLPPVPSTRTTHSICDDCTEALRESGLSK